MIFVIFGNSLQPFERLADFACHMGTLTDNEVVFQNGRVRYEKAFGNVNMVGSVSREKFEHLIFKSDFVITHCGAGTLRTLNAQKKKAIGLPRLKKFSEHVNDHQLQIAKQFFHMNKLFVPETWSHKSQPVEKTLSGFHDFDFRFDGGSEELANQHIGKLLKSYLTM